MSFINNELTLSWVCAWRSCDEIVSLASRESDVDIRELLHLLQTSMQLITLKLCYSAKLITFSQQENEWCYSMGYRREFQIAGQNHFDLVIYTISLEAVNDFPPC